MEVLFDLEMELVVRSAFQKCCLFVDVSVVQILASSSNPVLLEFSVPESFQECDLFVNIFPSIQ